MSAVNDALQVSLKGLVEAVCGMSLVPRCSRVPLWKGSRGSWVTQKLSHDLVARLLTQTWHQISLNHSSLGSLVFARDADACVVDWESRGGDALGTTVLEGHKGEVLGTTHTPSWSPAAKRGRPRCLFAGH